MGKYNGALLSFFVEDSSLESMVRGRKGYLPSFILAPFHILFRSKKGFGQGETYEYIYEKYHKNYCRYHGGDDSNKEDEISITAVT